VHLKKLRERAESLLLGRYRWHLLMCVGPDCCGAHAGKAAWKALKQALRRRGLDGDTVLRTKADCLGVCRNGPILVVYPGGTWYAGLNADRMERIVEEHLVQGRPVCEWIVAQNPRVEGAAGCPAFTSNQPFVL
jgi:(2Fe-2S) ferredoxin